MNPKAKFSIDSIAIDAMRAIELLVLFDYPARRFIAYALAFSKKVENHEYVVALHMMYNNFVRIHKTLRVTPTLEACVSDRLWELADIAKLVDDAESAPKARGPNKRNQ